MNYNKKKIVLMQIAENISSIKLCMMFRNLKSTN
jgi:hypothetical protein